MSRGAILDLFPTHREGHASPRETYSVDLEPQRSITCRAWHGDTICLRTAIAHGPIVSRDVVLRSGKIIRFSRRLYRCTLPHPHEFFCEWIEEDLPEEPASSALADASRDRGSSQEDQ